MKKLTDLQEQFIKKLDERFGLTPQQVEIDEIPYFESLFRVEDFLTQLKEKWGFRDTRDF